MNLEHITASNFVRLGEVNADLTTHTAHLFAGANEAGKTSMVEAIRFALFGDVLRVNRKSDYKQMIRDGAKKGSVEVQVDGRTFRRDIATGRLADPATGKVPKAGEEAIEEPGLPERYRFTLDAHRFSQLTPVDRRTLLMAVTGTAVNAEKVRAKLAARKITDEEAIDRLMPLLRSGFEAAAKEAGVQATQARADWKAITGENYGSLKAESWEPELPDVCPEAVAEAETTLDAARKAENSARSALADAKAAARAGKPHARIASLREEIATLPEDRKRLIEVTTAESDARGDVEDALAAFRAAQARQHIRECPACKAALVEKDGALVAADEAAITPEEVAAAEQPWLDAEDRLAEIRREKADLERRLMLGERLERELRELEALPDAGEAPDLAPLEDALVEASNAREQAEEQARTLRDLQQRVEQAEATKATALEHHRRVAVWVSLQEAFAPDGIPGELLADMLRPVNDRLAQTAAATGWDLVRIEPDMEITLAGRAYGLCSESAQWRADAALTDALVWVGGMGTLVLDRIDVLTTDLQVRLLKWIDRLARAGDYHRILLFGSYRALPPVPPSMTAHWLEAGEVSDPHHEGQPMAANA
jgi:DNA repair exonuclease SbcCD ATPase subunit